jgi:hypothetical protein
MRLVPIKYAAAAVGALAVFALCVVAPAVAQDAAVPTFKPSIDIPPVKFDHEEVRPSFWKFNGLHPSLAYLRLEAGPGGEERRAIVALDNRKNPKTIFYLEGEKPSIVSDLDMKSIRRLIDDKLTTEARLVATSLGRISIGVDDGGGAKRLIHLSFNDGIGSQADRFISYQCLTFPTIFDLEQQGHRQGFAILLKESDRNASEFDPKCRGDTEFVKPPRFLLLVPAKLQFAFSNRRLFLVQGAWVASIPYDISENDIATSNRMITGTQMEYVASSVPTRQTGKPTSYKSNDKMQAALDAALNRILEEKERKRK